MICMLIIASYAKSSKEKLELFCTQSNTFSIDQSKKIQVKIDEENDLDFEVSSLYDNWNIDEILDFIKNVIVDGYVSVIFRNTFIGDIAFKVTPDKIERTSFRIDPIFH